MAAEKGASSWLTTIPPERHGFALHKGAFCDALCLRYHWPRPLLPTHCCCNEPLTITHALSCPTGGFPSLRHNELWDIIAQLMDKVCKDVCIEPELQPLTNEGLVGQTANREDGARLDIATTGFWGNGTQRAFFDVRVFNPCAPSVRSLSPHSIYARNEKEKRRKYQQRVCEVERGSFTPLVFSSSGGMSKATTVTIKRLATLLAEKHGGSYSRTVGWLRTVLCSSLLRSAI